MKEIRNTHTKIIGELLNLGMEQRKYMTAMTKLIAPFSGGFLVA